MKAHELAKKLLDGPNLPVCVSVARTEDTIASVDEETGRPVELEVSENKPLKQIDIEGRVDSLWH